MSYDYVSPPLYLPHLVEFPGRVEGGSRWIVRGKPELADPHKWYHGGSGLNAWINSDEAAILYNSALRFQGQQALEIGSAMGFSAWHILAAGMRVHMCDPAFNHWRTNQKLLRALADHEGAYDLHAIEGHIVAPRLGRECGPWSLVFIDGNHERPYPAMEAVAASAYCAPDAMILLHDLCYDGPQEAALCLEVLGWKCRRYVTSRHLAVCWRGNVEPVEHVPDPALVELLG